MKGLAEELIKEGVITKSDVDIRNVIAAYSQKVGKTYALSEIFQNAKREGLIKRRASAAIALNSGCTKFLIFSAMLSSFFGI